MITLSESIDVGAPVEKAYELVADFARLAEWDPGTINSVQTAGDRLGIGSRYRVVAKFLGSRPELIYELMEQVPGKKVVYAGRARRLRSTDTIEFEDSGGGTRITFRAELRTSGPLRLVEPLLPMMLEKQARQSLDALRRALA